MTNRILDTDKITNTVNKTILFLTIRNMLNHFGKIQQIESHKLNKIITDAIENN